MRTRSPLLTGLVALIALTGLLTSPAAADSGGDAAASESDEEASRAFMTEFGVPQETQDTLINAAKQGNTTEADDPEALPLTIERQEATGSVYEVSKYADGSIAVIERELPSLINPGPMQPQAVTGCSVSSGSGHSVYTGCKVHYRTPVFSYGFYANFTLVQGANNDHINSVSNQFQEYAIGHTRDSWNLRVVKGNETSTGPANAELAIQYTVYPGIGQITKGVRLMVGGNTYWQANS